jgi:hypothetical protein
MTPLGIDPTTFRFVAQCLNHCAPIYVRIKLKNRLLTLQKLLKGHEFVKLNIKIWDKIIYIFSNTAKKWEWRV